MQQNLPQGRKIAPTTEVERIAVDGDCPECGAAKLQRYPVLSFGGWFMAVKCQKCLHSLSREPWTRLGTFQLAEDSFL